jgi:hypothetical protein
MVAKVHRIYVASSWRNSQQPEVVAALRAEGHEVYDFRAPAPGKSGFSWSAIDPDWLNWKPPRFSHLVTTHPIIEAGFALDKAALDWCDVCVLVLPCGRSAHLEAGYAAGQGKHVVVLLSPDGFEPELMYLLCGGLAHSIGDVLVHIQHLPPTCTRTAGWDFVYRGPPSGAVAPETTFGAGYSSDDSPFSDGEP